MATIQETHPDTDADRKKPLAVTVNNRPVTFGEPKATGMEIKDTAISQGVAIQRDFALFIAREGGKLKPVRDDEEITLRKDEAFRAVAPDDNSAGAR